MSYSKRKKKALTNSENENSKEALFKKMKEQHSQRPKSSSPSIESEEADSHYKKLYRSVKKELDKLKNTQSAEGKSAALELQRAKDDLTQVKRQLFEKNEELKVQINLTKETEKKLLHSEENNIKLEEEVSLLRQSEAKYKKAIEKMAEKTEAASKQEASYTRKHNQLRKKEDSYKEEISTLEQLLSNERRERGILEAQVNSIFDVDPTFIFDYFLKSLSLENVEKYHRLKPLYHEYKRIRNHKIRIKKAAAVSKVAKRKADSATNKETDLNNNDIDPQYGYLSRNPSTQDSRDLNLTNPNEDKWFFINSVGQTFTVVDYPKSVTLYEGIPASAIINEADMTAIYLYSFMNEREMNAVKKEITNSKQKKSPSEEKIYPYIAPISVLVLTAQNGDKYRDRLKKHGIHAEFAELYSDNPTHIKNKASSYDIVLLLEKHIPAVAQGLINTYQDSDPDKVQIMFNYNEDLVVARIRYVAIKKGWLELPFKEDKK